MTRTKNKDERHDEAILVKVSESEKKELAQYAKNENRSLSNYLITAGLERWRAAK